MGSVVRPSGRRGRRVVRDPCRADGPVPLLTLQAPPPAVDNQVVRDERAKNDVDAGLFSYTQILHLLKIEFSRARRYQYELSCILLEIDRLGEKQIVQLIDAGLLETPGDLFHLDRDADKRAALLSAFPEAQAWPQDSMFFGGVHGVEELDARLMVAAQSESPVILDFYADWCVSCLEMERFTFHDQRVANLMSQFTLLQADVTKNDETDQLLLKRFGIFGPPAILFFPPAEDEKRQYRVVGFMDADDFSSLLAHFLPFSVHFLT